MIKIGSFRNTQLSLLDVFLYIKNISFEYYFFMLQVKWDFQDVQYKAPSLCPWKGRVQEYLAKLKHYVRYEMKAIKNKVLSFCKVLRYSQMHMYK